MPHQDPFKLNDTLVPAGSRMIVDLPISALSNRLPMSLPVQVIHGRRPGPTMFVSAAVHGDEIIGVEILRRLMKRPALDRLKGTLMLIPVVNGYGFLNHSRYLPDRRDLNRCFPGSATGSLAHRLSNMFLEQVVKRADYGIDLHSAAIHRSNLPQIRIHEGDATLMDLARAFGAQVVLTSSLRDGSLRESASQMGVPVMLFEGGEGLRFDEHAIRAGVAGILRVMAHVGMIDQTSATPARHAPYVSNASSWVRAPAGGILRLSVSLGGMVKKGDVVGALNDLFGEQEQTLTAPADGIVIGQTNLPVVNEGDAVLHIAEPARRKTAKEKKQEATRPPQPALAYEDEII
ncbi:M14 family metallopeptidase [Parvularcula sp. LCG005]|uniref:succinylglutamate desuccinylase/aspartoacylase family protein n=1 Tax=Parvularcula sp. LCG005 TaxID=3078805 RepID=UPI002941C607|nr:M14 family metallopeptidase [Parvularcula sp. LCG005]WOI53912.1 M14 family metallopeptidase [Parvularcula sp. LCG005]